MKLQSVALRFGKLQKALSISFKILSDFSWLSAETRILKLVDTKGREAFSSIILQVFVDRFLSPAFFFPVVFFGEESENIKSPMRKKRPFR